MKTINQKFSACIIFAAIVALPINIIAQDNVKASLKAFISNDDIKFTSKISEIKDPKTNHIMSMCNVYNFSISRNDESYYFDDIYKAFEKDQDVAYWSIRQDANSAKRETYNLIYGDDGAYITVGAMQNQNLLVMNVVDKTDSTHRYSYVLEWIADDKSKKINGAVIFIYGKIPNKKQPSIYENNPFNNNFFKMNGDTIFYNLDGKEYKMLRPNFNKDMTVPSEFLNNYSCHENNENNENTTVGWLSKFNVLKNLYKGDESTLNYSIVAKINDLCKRSGKLLSKREKELCTESLEEMKQKTKDKFQKGLLDESIDYIKQ